MPMVEFHKWHLASFFSLLPTLHIICLSVCCFFGRVYVVCGYLYVTLVCCG